MRCFISAAFNPKVKYRHYYTAEISNSTDGAPFWFHKIYIGYIGSWTTWILYYFDIPLSNYQNIILSFTSIFYLIIQISLSHPAVNALYTIEWAMFSLLFYNGLMPGWIDLSKRRKMTSILPQNDTYIAGD